MSFKIAQAKQVSKGNFKPLLSLIQAFKIEYKVLNKKTLGYGNLLKIKAKGSLNRIL